MRRRAVLLVAVVGLLAGAACQATKPPPPPPGTPPPPFPAPAPSSPRPPDPVTSLALAADPAINRVTVSWQPPAGGPAPESYSLGVHENGFQVGAFVCYAPCTQRTINVTPGVSASVRMRAVNSGGSSEVRASNPVQVAQPCPLACVQVDATQSNGPAIGRARGFLHSIGPNTDPARIDALQPEHWRVSGTRSGGLGPEHAARHGAKLTYLLSDDWHVQTRVGEGAAAPWADWNRYTTFITDTVNAVRAKGITVEYWEVQNEPAGSDRYYAAGITPTIDQLLLQFKVAYQAIKAADPGAKVVAPSLVAYRDQPGELGGKLDLRTFLDYAVANGLAFDAISFHDINYLHRPDVYARDWWGMAPDEVIRSIERLRALIAERPSLGSPAILVNEYSDSTTQGLPGWSVGRIAALEAANVDEANRTCWGTCEDGWLDGLLIGDGETTYPAYWVYAYYAQMTGNRAPVTTSNTSVTAFAATAPDGTVRVMLGRHEGCRPDLQAPNCPNQPVLDEGEVTVEVRVPSLLGPLPSVALVSADAIPASTSPLAGPVPSMTNQPVVVADGVAKVTLPAVRDGDAWQITITPV